MNLSLMSYRVSHRRLYPPNWKSIEESDIARVGRCQFCLSRIKLQVHHIIPVHVRPDLNSEPINLIVLCEPCHLRFGHLGDFKRYWDPEVRSRASDSFE